MYHSSDVAIARGAARATATTVGFDERTIEEIALAASELASNLVKHAGGGMLLLSGIATGGRTGMQIESLDSGPGIGDVDQAMADGFSTAGGLGYGLGAVNRLMDEVEFSAGDRAGAGTRVVCRRWVRLAAPNLSPCPLEVGAATRRHPATAVNGDTFVVKQWDASILVAVIDGVGHGRFAHRAAQAARQFVESHFDQPLPAIFLGAGRACRATHGVVMALARFDWAVARLVFASVGNVQARVLGASIPMSFIVRRGIVGLNAPNPAVTEHDWDPQNVMVLHSDGLSSGWRWEDFQRVWSEPAGAIARRLLVTLARDDDDATVLVVKRKLDPQ